MVYTVPVINDAISISCRYQYVCVVRVQGSVQCWFVRLFIRILFNLWLASAGALMQQTDRTRHQQGPTSCRFPRTKCLLAVSLLKAPLSAGSFAFSFGVSFHTALQGPNSSRRRLTLWYLRPVLHAGRHNDQRCWCDVRDGQ